MNEERVFLKPGTLPDGTPMKARKPMGGFLAESGEFVILDSYWRRRLLDKDVAKAKPPVAEATTAEVTPLVETPEPKAEAKAARRK